MKKFKPNQKNAKKPEVLSCCGTVCNKEIAVKEHIELEAKLEQASKDMVVLIICAYLASLQMQMEVELDEAVLDDENELVDVVMMADFKVHLSKDQIVTEVAKMVADIKGGLK